jgi:tight adherence protein C
VILLLPLLAFVFASLLVAAGAMALSGGETATLERRLGEIQIGGPIEMKPEDTEYRRAMLDMLKRVGNVAPRSSSEMGKLQQRLLAAGYRSKEALIIFFGIRAACALAFFAVVMSSIVVRPSLWVAFAACGLGYLLPSMMLGRLAKKRQHRIRLGLPDALDLLVVSVEAGLGLDQAIQRVGLELDFAHPDLSLELSLINRSWRCSSRPTSSAPAWRSRCASTPRRCGRNGASAPRKRRRRPASRWSSPSCSASSRRFGS